MCIIRDAVHNEEEVEYDLIRRQRSARKSHKKEIQVPSFVQLHDLDGKDIEFQKPIYVSKTDYIDDTNVRL